MGNLCLFCTLWILPPDAKLASVHKSSPSRSFCGLCGPEPPAQHDPRSHCESCSELTLIQGWFGEGSLAGDALQCSGGGWLSWYSDKITFLSLECDRDLLSLGVQRLAFPFPLPSAAHGTPLGTSSLLLCIPVLWDKPWGGAWSPGALTLFLFCSQCSGI